MVLVLVVMGEGVLGVGEGERRVARVVQPVVQTVSRVRERKNGEAEAERGTKKKWGEIMRNKERMRSECRGTQPTNENRSREAGEK